MAQAHLESLRQRAHENRALADSLVSGMSDAQLGWRPTPKSWSAFQVLEHLNRASLGYHPRIERTIARSHERGLTTTPPFRAGWFQNWFIRQLEPEATRPLKAPASFVASPEVQVDPSVRQRFFEYSEALQSLLDDAEAVHLCKVRFGSPITSLIRFNIGEALWLLVAHEHRHLLQIQRLVDHPQYPQE